VGHIVTRLQENLRGGSLFVVQSKISPLTLRQTALNGGWIAVCRELFRRRRRHARLCRPKLPLEQRRRERQWSRQWWKRSGTWAGIRISYIACQQERLLAYNYSVPFNTSCNSPLQSNVHPETW